MPVTSSAFSPIARTRAFRTGAPSRFLPFLVSVLLVAPLAAHADETEDAVTADPAGEVAAPEAVPSSAVDRSSLRLASPPSTHSVREAAEESLREAREAAREEAEAERAAPTPGSADIPTDVAQALRGATPRQLRIAREHLRPWEAPPAAESSASALEERIDAAFSGIVGAMYRVLFFNVLPDALRDRMQPRRTLSIALEHPDAEARLARSSLADGIEVREGLPFSADADALRAWLETVDAGPDARAVIGPVTTYDQGMGDRVVVGYRAVLVRTEPVFPGELVQSVAVRPTEDEQYAAVVLGFDEAHALWEPFQEAVGVHASHRVAFLVNDTLAARPRVSGPLTAPYARLMIDREGPAERHFREIRDLSVELRAELLPGPRVPFIVLWLIVGAVFFTLRMGFVNVRAFRHAIDVVRGKYDDPNHKGEVSHFQALASALSATVGLGNIAGVAIAIAIGGPGAVFWMMVAAFFGMTSKFVECTLGQAYRSVDERGRVLGGPMMYLHFGLKERGLGGLGRVLALIFMVFCIGGSLGGGNMFQANQAYQAMNGITPFHLPPAVFGLVLITAVGAVIIGGIKRIGQAAAAIVPLMCALYLLATVFVLVINAHNIPYALAHIVGDAFTDSALYGGVVGVLIIGFQRAAFSNEAGIGSAAIAHSAARTDQPVREGVVALLEPFIDTMVVCLATGLVIVVSGVLDTPQGAELAANGALLTSAAFGSAISWFPIVLAVAITLFAYSTMLAWSYYGERCWTGLFGNRSSTAYKVIFLFFIYVGCVANLGAVVDFSDLMILSMAFPNILGLFLLSGKVRKDLDAYLRQLRDGAFRRH